MYETIDVTVSMAKAEIWQHIAGERAALADDLAALTAATDQQCPARSWRWSWR
jgi:hypothetical protein